MALSAQRSRAELVACETCGNAQRDAEGRVPGETLLAALRAALATSTGMSPAAASVRCLWACKRSCAVALRSTGRVGYLLADLEPTEISARALVDYAALYAASDDGAVPYRTWPAAIKGHFLCRFPKAADPRLEDAGPNDAGPEDAGPEDAGPAAWNAAGLDSGDPEAAER